MQTEDDGKKQSPQNQTNESFLNLVQDPIKFGVVIETKLLLQNKISFPIENPQRKLKGDE